ncbi:hypothetical protein SRB5_11330 [Streptomyces sp. RB5]|uniref:Uncharacterized protein n=1 Tax=Streptomyces smaragdinus TaxID=2585196 RepID=A0A7K0CC54_9ACTN|nr:hypothetical protein [Streptomyces smaragdinus]MQY11019.1 hypothetical protein [Streptomyces smaragdinus]
MTEDRPARRSWTASVEERSAATILAMPPDLAKQVTNFFAALALEAGGALAVGRRPPGDLLDDSHNRYGLQIPGESVLFEYELHHDIREIRIPVIVWLG